MKAILYRDHGGPAVLDYVDLPDPRPAAGEVLVHLQAASVSPFDCKLRAGLLRGYFDLPLPKVPGRDGAGVVVAVGDGVGGLVAGDRVGVMAPHLTQGGYATMIACSRDAVARAPVTLSSVETAALVNAGVSAWTAAVETAGIESGQRVLVHGGAGAVGGLLVQLCRHLGADVTATCRAVNRDYVLGLGADRVVAYDEDEFSSLRDQDVVFDLIGGEVHDRSYPTLKKGGQIVWLVASPIVDRGAEFGVRVTRAMITDDPKALAALMQLAADGVIVPQVSRVMALSQAADAHRLMESGAITRGRLVLTME